MDKPSKFLFLPAEIRLVIYELLMVNDDPSRTIAFESESQSAFKTRKSLRRTKYRILSNGIQPRACDTTYVAVSPKRLHTNILATNHQIYEEASFVLYGKNHFAFGAAIPAIIPFLSDLTPSSRALITSLSLTKRPFVYSRDFDRCEWSNFCNYVSVALNLSSLELKVIGGVPIRGWQPTTYSADEFRTLAKAGYGSMDWVQEMTRIKGLKHLTIIPELGPCPPPSSTAMEFFAAFSASIETGFAGYLRSEMVSAAA